TIGPLLPPAEQPPLTFLSLNSHIAVIVVQSSAPLLPQSVSIAPDPIRYSVRNNALPTHIARASPSDEADRRRCAREGDRGGGRERLTGWRRSPRAALLFGVVATLVVVFVVAFVVAPLTLTHRSSWPLEERFGGFAVDLVTRFHAGGDKNPRTADRQTLEQGQ